MFRIHTDKHDLGLGAEETLRAQNQQLVEEKRYKDEFLAMLAHEFRSPLTALLNASRVLRVGGDKAVEREWVAGLLERQTRQLVTLTEDLFDVCRLGRDKVLLRQERLDLVQLVLTAAGDCRSTMEAAHLSLRLAIPKDSIWVLADPVRLTQVICNLLHNAAKFTDPGGCVTASLARDETSHEAVLRVQDTGIGIEPAMIPRLFEAFSQVGRSRARSGGLGLGLALVKGFVELHGGKVQAFSDGPGKGSAFVVRLPMLVDPQPARNDEETELTDPLPAETPPRRVLIVDDNRESAEVTSLLLQRRGHEVFLAYDGPEALEAARTFQPEVVFLDISLPGMSGYEVARALRLQPGLENALLVAVTGWGEDEHRRRAFEAGFDTHLTKPVRIEMLEQLITSDLIPT